MGFTLGDIAKISGAELNGDPGLTISKVSPLQNAEAGDLSFLANRRHIKYLESTRATAVILAAEHRDRCPVAALVCEDPYLAFARTLRHIRPEPGFTPGVHPTAVTGEDCSIDDTAFIGAHAVIGQKCLVGPGSYVGPGCVLGDCVKIGRNTRLASNVSLSDDVEIRDNGILHPGVVVGADGFGIVKEEDRWLKIPQTGTVKVGNDVEIGANTTIDRGALQDTLIGEGVKLDNQIQVGHGVIIGDHTAIAGCVAIAGSVIIGKRCMIGGLSAISGHIEIADDVVITGMSAVSNSIGVAGIYSSGIPVTENARWRRNIARFKKLDDIARRLFALERHIGRDSHSQD